MFFGRFVLNLFGISLPVLKIAGGLIVANTAWGMVIANGSAPGTAGAITPIFGFLILALAVQLIWDGVEDF